MMYTLKEYIIYYFHIQNYPKMDIKKREYQFLIFPI